MRRTLNGIIRGVLCALGLSVLAAGIMFGGEAGGAPAGQGQAAGGAAGSQPETGQSVPSITQPSSYVPVLGGGPNLLPFGTGLGSHLLYGGDLSGIYYSSHFGSLVSSNGTMTSGSGFLGYTGSTATNVYTLQYTVTGMPYSNPNFGTGGVMNRGLFRFDHHFSAKTSLTMSASGGYGSDALLFYSPMQFQAIGGVAGLDGAALGELGALNGKFGSATGNVSLEQRLTATKTLTFTGSYYYYEFLPGTTSSPSSSLFSGSSRGITGSAGYDQEVSERTTLRVRGMYSKYFAGSTLGSCGFYSLEGGVTYELSARTTVSALAGPTMSSGHLCGSSVGLSASGRISTSIRQSLSAYVTAARAYYGGYIAGGGAVDTAAAGLNKGLGRQLIFSIDAGYYATSFVSTSGSYRGFFGASSLSFLLTRSLSLVATYQRYSGLANHLIPNQEFDAAMLSLRWNHIPGGSVF